MITDSRWDPTGHEGTGRTSRRELLRRWVVGVAPVLLFGWGLIPALFTSLSVDEGITYWVVKDGFEESIRRALHFQGQSPFYFLVAWGTGNLLGWSEWLLRLPSLLFLGLGCLVLYCIARSNYDHAGASVAVSGFVATWIFLEGACNARPYNLAILCALTSVWSLLRWVERGAGSWRTLYVLSSAAAIYAHILFLPILMLHIVLFVLQNGSRRDPGAKQFALNLVAVAMLAVPNLYQLGLLLEKRGLYNFPPIPTLSDLMAAWLPRGVAPFWLVGLLAALLATLKTRVLWRSLRSPAFLGSLIWWLLPAGLFFVISHLGIVSIFGSWYFSWFAPGYALFISATYAALVPSRGRQAAEVVFCCSLLLAVSVRADATEDWRGAVAYINCHAEQNETVFFWPGLIETSNSDWMADPGKRDYLLAPLNYYTLKSPPVLLPLSREPGWMDALLLDLARPGPGDQRGIWLLLRSVELVAGEPRRISKSEKYFAEAFESAGFSVTKTLEFKNIRVLQLEGQR